MTRVPDRTEPDDAADPPCEPPAMPAALPEGARLLAGSGARATENLLFERLAPLVAVARADVRLLATPVRVVVPSRSLREHVSAAIVRHFGAAVAGVEVQTEPRLRAKDAGGAGEIGVQFGCLVAFGQRRCASIEKLRQPAEDIAEKPRDPQRHVDARAVQKRQRQDFKTRNPV